MRRDSPLETLYWSGKGLQGHQTNLPCVSDCKDREWDPVVQRRDKDTLTISSARLYLCGSGNSGLYMLQGAKPSKTSKFTHIMLSFMEDWAGRIHDARPRP